MQKVTDWIKQNHNLIYIGLSFYIFDLYIRYINLSINFGSLIGIAPNLFTYTWIIIFISIMLLLKSKYRKIFILIVWFIFCMLLLVNYIYLILFNNFFRFKDIGLADEGVNYFDIVFSFINVPLVMIIIASLLFIILGIKFMPKNETKRNWLVILILLMLATLFYCGAILRLGKATDGLSWDAWNNRRNVFNSFNIARKSLQISGFYEYIFRDLYLTYLRPHQTNNEVDIEYLDNYFAQNVGQATNDNYFAEFKDKNLILVMMESIDHFLITPDIMPTVYKMMYEGINVINHYAPIYGGGATFNSEFMVNTGLMTPFNTGYSAYMYNNNNYYYSLPNIFKRAGYEVNAVHFNFASFYDRDSMYKAFGYGKIHGSRDVGIPQIEAILDSHLIANEKISKYIVPNANKFMSFIITYTPHVPYDAAKEPCSLLLSGKLSNKEKADMEMTCIALQAGETDKFFKLLIEKLAEENKLDNTVIIAFSDHYTPLSGNRRYELKGITDNNLIHNTPLFIWSNNITPKTIEKVSSNIDILPTIASLFGLEYNPKHYLGENIFNSNDKGFVFFSDYSWYDGDIYYKNNEIVKGSNIDLDYIKKRNQQIHDMLRLNSSILNTDYFDKRNDSIKN